MTEEKKKPLVEVAQLLLDHKRQDALDFLDAYSRYCHDIDDIIDDPAKRNDPHFILQTFALGEKLFSSYFYQQYYIQLYPTLLLINNTYRQSVEFERTDNPWKLKHADVLRHCAHDMVCLIIMIVTGNQELMYQFSVKLREYAEDDDFAPANNQPNTFPQCQES